MVNTDKLSGANFTPVMDLRRRGRERAAIVTVSTATSLHAARLISGTQCGNHTHSEWVGLILNTHSEWVGLILNTHSEWVGLTLNTHSEWVGLTLHSHSEYWMGSVSGRGQ